MGNMLIDRIHKMYTENAPKVHKSISMMGEEDSAEPMDAASLWKPLNDYVWKANDLVMKGNELLVAGTECTALSQGRLHAKLLRVKDDAEQLYSEYRWAFEGADAVLKQHGMQTEDYSGVSFFGQNFALDNSFFNDEWGWHFDGLIDKVQKALFTSNEVAERLMGNLNRISDGESATSSEVSSATA